MTRLRILLVEDDAAHAELTRQVLRDTSLDHTLEVATDGDSGLDRIRSGGPWDLVLLDLNLPRRSGLEILTELRAGGEDAGPPVIVVTSSSDPADLYATATLDADGYVSKPLSADQLEFEYYRARKRRRG